MHFTDFIARKLPGSLMLNFDDLLLNLSPKNLTRIVDLLTKKTRRQRRRATIGWCATFSSHQKILQIYLFCPSLYGLCPLVFFVLEKATCFAGGLLLKLLGRNEWQAKGFDNIKKMILENHGCGGTAQPFFRQLNPKNETPGI